MGCCCSVALVSQDGDHLLYYPLPDSSEQQLRALAATAKCRLGTAVWAAFQTGRPLHYQDDVRWKTLRLKKFTAPDQLWHT